MNQTWTNIIVAAPALNGLCRLRRCAGNANRTFSRYLAVLIVSLISMMSAAPAGAELALSEVDNDAVINALKGGILPANTRPTRHSLPQTFEGTPNFGYIGDDHTAWLALRVRNDTEQPEWFLLINAPATDYIDVYSVPAGQTVNLTSPDFVAGDRRPSDLRDYPFPGYLVSLNIQPGEVRDIYVASYGRSTLALDISLNDKQTQVGLAARGMLVDVLLIALSIAMLIFNLIMWQAGRERFRFEYVIYLSGIILFAIYNSGLGYLYVWPDSSFFQQNVAFWGLAMFFWGGYSFCQHFLKTNLNYPRLHRVMGGLRWVGILSIPFGLLGMISLAVSIVTLANLIFFIMVIYLGISSTRKGLNSALIFLVSWSGMVICSVIYNLYVQGLLPSGFFVQRALLVGVAYESVLMSVAQANFLRNVHRSREQQEAIAKEEALQTLSKLDVALADARNANRSKDEFLRLVSHELRTPIAQALGALDELGKLGDVSLSSDQRSSFNALHNATHTTHHQVESLLSYAGLLAYPVVSRPKVVDVRTRLQDCTERLNATVMTHGSVCTLDGDKSLPPALLLDWNNTQHILDHVLDAALRHSQPGNIAICVHFDQAAQRLNLSLRHPNPVDAIHATPDNSSDSPSLSGRTLNLFLSQAFADILEAELTREQLPEQTLTRLSLPCSPAPAEPPQPAAQSTPTLPTLSGLTALIVEDNVLNLKLLSTILQREQCKIDVAYDGVGALERAGSRRYDFILMDCQMPKMDGFEATRLIRKNEGPNRNTPILAITANTIERDRKEATAAGMDDLIPKPFSRPILVERLLHWRLGRLN